MAKQKVVSQITKYKLPQGQSFLLESKDLEACLSGRSKKDTIYLDLVFQDRLLTNKKLRDRLETQGHYQLLKFRYDPENKGMTEWQHENGPWKGAKKPIIVEGWIYDLSKDLTSKTGVNGKKIQKILTVQLNKLLKKGLPSKAWKLSLLLSSKDKTVECSSVTWNGHGEEAEAKQIVSLDKV